MKCDYDASHLIYDMAPQFAELCVFSHTNIAPNKQPKLSILQKAMNLLCGGGTFTFGGAHGSIGVASAFSGYIHETDSLNGQSVGSL
jgi:hypothetical protein